MKKIKWGISLLFCIQLTYGQEKIIDAYNTYFESSREVVHLHLNKTSFLMGEEIWFKAYVLEQNSKKLHPTSSNLYVSLFNENGSLKKQHLVKIKNGIGRGSFKIDSTFVDKNYIIKASTSFMRNFKEDHSYSQKIKIIKDKIDKNITTKNEANFYDFQVFPEGGYLVENVASKVGILLKDANNKGIQIENGFIKEKESNKTIASFTTNIMGLGNAIFLVNQNKKYYVEATLKNGVVLTKNIPIAKKQGLVINVKNNINPYLEITLSTNKTTLPTIANKEFRVLIHNTNKYYNRTIKFPSKEKALTLFVKKSLLTSGVNIITIFDENDTPILERLFFNYNKELFVKPGIEEIEKVSDSLSFEIKNNSNEAIHLSASLLPSDTRAYQPKNSIYSSFLLKPYIKGDISNVAYYFKKPSKKGLKELDVLLLTQGWSKYEWKHIFNEPPKEKFNFETGIDLTLKFNQKIGKNESILIYSPENQVVKTLTKEENPFTIKNTFVQKGSKFKITLLKKDDFIRINPSINYSNHTLLDNINVNAFDFSNEESEVEISNFKNLTPEIETLDEITLTTEIKDWDNKVTGYATSLRRYKADEIKDPTNELAYFIENFIREYSFSNRPFGGAFVNNEPITLDDAYFTQMDEVREIAIGTDPSGKVTLLYVFTYSGEEFKKIQADNMNSVTIPIGFAVEKEYYAPKYPSYTNQSYVKFGAISWISDISLQPNETKLIQVNAYYPEEMKLFIEGATQNGKLYVDEILIKE